MADLPKLSAFVVFRSAKSMVECYKVYHESRSERIYARLQSLAGSNAENVRKLNNVHTLKV